MGDSVEKKTEVGTSAMRKEEEVFRKKDSETMEGWQHGN